MLNLAESDSWQKYKPSIFVFGLSLSLTLIGVLPFWRQLGFCPNFFLALFYIWLLYRPDLMNHRQILTQALLKDCLFLAPIGTNLVVNLILYVFVFGARNWLLSQPFIMVYGVFILLAGLDQCLYWLIIKLFLPNPFPLRHILLSVVMVGLIFPVFSHLSLRWQQKLEN